MTSRILHMLSLPRSRICSAQEAFLSHNFTCDRDKYLHQLPKPKHHILNQQLNFIAVQEDLTYEGIEKYIIRHECLRKI